MIPFYILSAGDDFVIQSSLNLIKQCKVNIKCIEYQKDCKLKEIDANNSTDIKIGNMYMQIKQFAGITKQIL